MNYPFDTAQPPTPQSQHLHNAPQHPTCVIHPYQINPEGKMLVQVHTHNNNGQTQTQSYYVSNADLPAFLQQHKQQFPSMQFTKQERPNAGTHSPTQPLTHESVSTHSTFAAPYDKFDSIHSPCAEFATVPRDDNC
jgi:hypothetical protein